MTDLICLECWRPVLPDLHFDCTGEHEVPRAEADEIHEWLTGRYAFMVSTGQRQQFEGWRYISRK